MLRAGEREPTASSILCARYPSKKDSFGRVVTFIPRAAFFEPDGGKLPVREWQPMHRNGGLTMKPSILALMASALLATSAVAVAQTPPTDPQTKTDKESPTTMGTGSGAQGADATVGQKPATDPQSKEKMKAPNAGTSGASTGEQGADATPGQKPATDPQSKDKNEGVGAQ
jgi:hypothetical protein